MVPILEMYECFPISFYMVNFSKYPMCIQRECIFYSCYRQCSVYVSLLILLQIWYILPDFLDCFLCQLLCIMMQYMISCRKCSFFLSTATYQVSICAHLFIFFRKRSCLFLPLWKHLAVGSLCKGHRRTEHGADSFIHRTQKSPKPWPFLTHTFC